MAFDHGALPFPPPLAPMLSVRTDGFPAEGEYLFEPKWDGFRALVFRAGSELFTQSRDLKPLDRYFPELREPILAATPELCVLDGEIVVARGGALEFEVLQMRLHPAKSRVDKLAKETPAAFVAFDLLALGTDDLRGRPQRERRSLLEASVRPNASVHVTPMTRDRALAQEWFERFEGAGLDGVIAKHAELTYQPNKRAMLKIKHVRTADCVVAGLRWHKQGKGTLVGSLLLGLYDSQGRLHHVGITSSFKMAMRAQLVEELRPLFADKSAHAWNDEGWGDMDQRKPGMQSRWSAGKDLSFVPLRPERVCEVKFDHLQGSRFRHATTFVRWRPDKPPRECGYDQIETTPPYELRQIFGG